MEIRVELDEEVVEELDEEAQLQGFDDRGAYLRWIVAHRPMSELASTEAPAVASRVSELEERIKLVERQIGLDDPVDPDADLGGTGGASGTISLSSNTGGTRDTSDDELSESIAEIDTETDGVDDDELSESIAEVDVDTENADDGADDELSESITESDGVDADGDDGADEPTATDAGDDVSVADVGPGSDDASDVDVDDIADPAETRNAGDSGGARDVIEKLGFTAESDTDSESESDSESETEAEAADDDIAEAIGDVDIDDEE